MQRFKGLPLPKTNHRIKKLKERKDSNEGSQFQKKDKLPTLSPNSQDRFKSNLRDLRQLQNPECVHNILRP